MKNVDLYYHYAACWVTLKPPQQHTSFLGWWNMAVSQKEHFKKNRLFVFVQAFKAVEARNMSISFI